LFLYLDGCNNFLDFLHFLLLRLFLNNTTIRRNVFNFNHVSYLKAWSKLEGTPITVNVELDLPLANINGSSHGLEERPRK
jgi:hypothetical protein